MRGWLDDVVAEDGYTLLMPPLARAALGQGAVLLVPLRAASELWIYPAQAAPSRADEPFVAKVLVRLDARGRIALPGVIMPFVLKKGLDVLIAEREHFTLCSSEPLLAKLAPRS